jgi:hypothetical protein
MSSAPRHFARVRPAKLAAARMGEEVVADLGATARRLKEPEALARHLAERLGVEVSSDPVEQLRWYIDREVDTRGLHGCAVVRPASTEDGERARAISDLGLALVLLSKSSDVVWVARKTPVIESETLGRRLLTRDSRFAAGGSS